MITEEDKGDLLPPDKPSDFTEDKADKGGCLQNKTSLALYR